MRFVDSHTHLADPAFDGDRDVVIGRARDAGAAALVCVGESIERAHAARAIAAAHPGFIWFTAGVHPHDAAGFDPARDIPALTELLQAGVIRDSVPHQTTPTGTVPANRCQQASVSRQ